MSTITVAPQVQQKFGIAPVTQVVTVQGSQSTVLPRRVAAVRLSDIIEQKSVAEICLRSAREKVIALQGLLDEEAPMLAIARRQYEAAVAHCATLRQQAHAAQAA
jgi:hypothetical protein